MSEGKIWLSAENPSSLGEKTFWGWAAEEFPNAHFLPRERDLPISFAFADDDVVLRYSTLGPCPIPGGKKIALLWELHHEMRRTLGGGAQLADTIARIEACARESDACVIASEVMRPYYDNLALSCGSVDCLPIGVDTNLFRPPASTAERLAGLQKFGLPFDRPVILWVGTNHPMKGFADGIPKIVEQHAVARDAAWALVWKSRRERVTNHELPHTKEFITLPQADLAELMRACNWFACTGKLRPYFMCEWEAMAANMPFLCVRGDKAFEREFEATENPRKDVMRLNWDRATAKGIWLDYIERVRAGKAGR